MIETIVVFHAFLLAMRNNEQPTASLTKQIPHRYIGCETKFNLIPSEASAGSRSPICLPAP